VIRTVRNAAAMAALAAAALVSVPGTALADTVVGPTFVIGNANQIAGGDIRNVLGSDDGVVGELPGIGLPAPGAPIWIEVGPSVPLPGLFRVSQEGGEYPRVLPPDSLALIAPLDASSTASYETPGGNGHVEFILKQDERPRCTADGDVTCRFGFDPRRGQEVFIVDGNR
jgi:hypothetical protein